MTAAITIELSEHAIDRFHQRVRPALTWEEAEYELDRLTAYGEMVVEPPHWLARTQRQHACCYLLVGDLVLPLVPAYNDREVLCATTCIPRGALSDRARSRRNARRSTRARRRR